MVVVSPTSARPGVTSRAPTQPDASGPVMLRLYPISYLPCTPLLIGAVKENPIGDRTSGRAGLTLSVPTAVCGTVLAGGVLDREVPQPASSTAAQTTTGTALRVAGMTSRDYPWHSRQETVDFSTIMADMETAAEARLDGVALEAWRSYLQSHASIVRVLDAELHAEHAITTRDYEVMLYLAQADGRQLAMSALAQRTMLTRSGITRLIDGLVTAGLVQRVACRDDARVSYARLTDAGHDKLRRAGATHVASVNRLFVERFDAAELRGLADLLSRLPGTSPNSSCTIE
jgi:DNA-binding MarR family transcriptional regulator